MPICVIFNKKYLILIKCIYISVAIQYVVLYNINLNQFNFLFFFLYYFFFNIFYTFIYCVIIISHVIYVNY